MHFTFQSSHFESNEKKVIFVITIDLYLWLNLLIFKGVLSECRDLSRPEKPHGLYLDVVSEF